jgi:Ferritin-like domain
MSLGAESDGLVLAELDRDEAILEGIAAVYGESRARFLRRAVLGGAALLGALSAPPAAVAARTDTSILNFDLVFEYLQSSFYLSALHVGTVKRMTPEGERWARVLGAHELAHVRILRQVLGSKAKKKPFFDFHGVTESPHAFLRTAVAMEDLTVALLSGQAPRLHNRSLVSAVFSLLTVEARHAAWARRIAGFRPVGQAFDEPKSLDEVGRIVASTRFLAAAPRTKRIGRRPHYTG